MSRIYKSRIFVRIRRWRRRDLARSDRGRRKRGCRMENISRRPGGIITSGEKKAKDDS